jgi:hypothetical protein
MRRRAAGVVASLAFTWLFFAEYLSPLRRVHIPYDLEGYHYPLADYAFLSLRQGHFPHWDWSNYSGMPFAGNVQAALFYPPMWLLFLVNDGKEHLSYQSLQVFQFAHVWLGAVFCYVWLKRRGYGEFSALAGAQVFAFSGYCCTQLQHLGLIAGFAWFPLALWGVDEARERGRFRPLWKVSIAGGFCFLAGYPPMWVVFAVVISVYAAAGGWKLAARSVGAILISLGIAAVALLPGWQAKQFMELDARYGAGVTDPRFYLSLFLPDYYHFALHVPVLTNFGMDYLYLGLPALAGVTLALSYRRWREMAPAFFVLAASVVLLTNPFGAVWAVLQHSDLLAELVRSWYFLAGITVAATLLTAIGLDSFLKKTSPFKAPTWIIAPGLALAGWELWCWSRDNVPEGSASLYFTMLTVTLFVAGLLALRSAPRGSQRFVMAALLLFSAIDYKAFGTSKRFDAATERVPPFHRDDFPNLDPAAVREMQAHPEYRVLIDRSGPLPVELRHWGLRTPQGSDPLLTVQYRAALGSSAAFYSDRRFDLDPTDDNWMHRLGVRYVVTVEDMGFYKSVVSNPMFRLVGTRFVYYKTFEYLDATPSFALEGEGESLAVTQWEPALRAFHVRANGGARLRIAEQFLPGWTASVDGQPARIERWSGAFQEVALGMGDHNVEFRYSTPGLGWGAAISLISLAVVLRMALTGDQ